MYLIDKKQQLRDFATALAVPVGLTDRAKWPVRAGTVIFPVRNILVREFIWQIEKSGIKGNPDKWRKAFDGPTQLWRMSHHLVNGLMDENIDPSYIAKQILLFLEGISALNNNHYFERIGKHIILDDVDIQKAIAVDMIEGKKEARKVLMLAGILWAYSETNYFVAHELTCEYHGPYVLLDGNYAVIREFKNIRPVELWPERDYSNLPDFLRIITIHDNTLDIGFDAYNNLFDEKGTMASSLLRGAVCMADNQPISLNEVSQLLSAFSEKIECFTSEVDEMSKINVARKYMEVFWYRKKSLTDYMGISWKPTGDLYDTLEDGLVNGSEKKATAPLNSPDLVAELEKKYDYSAFLV